MAVPKTSMKKGALQVRNVNKIDQVPSQFFEWATKEMKFWKDDEENSPQETEFKMNCRGQMLKVAKFLTEKIRSDDTVFKIKGNLLLKKHSESSAGNHEDSLNSEITSIQLEKKQLQEDIIVNNESIKLLEDDIKQLELKLHKKDKKIRNSKEKLRNFRNKSRVSQLFCEFTQSRNCQYQNLVSELKEIYMKKKDFGFKDDKCRQITAGSFGSTEIACEKKLKEIKEAIEKKIFCFLEDKTKGTDSYGSQTEKEILPLIQELLQLFNSNQIKSGLLSLFTSANRDLQVAKASINIKEDVKKLRYRYESQGVLVDESGSQKVKDVSALLMDEHAKNVAIFLETRKAEAYTQHLKKQIANIQKQIDVKLQNLFEGNSDVIELAREFITCELNAVNAEAALQYLSKLKNTYQQELKQKCDEQSILEAALQKIRNFNEIAEMNKNFISELFNQITVDLPQLQHNTQCEINSYLKNNLTSESTKMPSIEEFSSISQLCIQDFQLLDSNQLLKFNINNDQSEEHDFQRFSFPRTSIIECSDILDIKTPFIKSQESMLEQSLLDEEKMSYGSCLKTLLATLSSSMHCDGKEIVIDHINNLIQTIKQHDKKQSDTLSELQKIYKDLDSVIGSCKSSEELFKDWKNQPAQFALPDYKIDGFNLKEWLEQIQNF